MFVHVSTVVIAVLQLHGPSQGRLMNLICFGALFGVPNCHTLDELKTGDIGGSLQLLDRYP